MTDRIAEPSLAKPLMLRLMPLTMTDMTVDKGREEGIGAPRLVCMCFLANSRHTVIVAPNAARFRRLGADSSPPMIGRRAVVRQD
jgi:hypothetical protein